MTQKQAHSPELWSVYQCESCKEDEPNSACGVNGEKFDHSRDECHHPLSIEKANRIVDCVNACSGMTDPKQAIEGLKKALRFYADPDNWKEPESGIGMQPSAVAVDYGYEAVKALKACGVNL